MHNTLAYNCIEDLILLLVHSTVGQLNQEDPGRALLLADFILINSKLPSGYVILGSLCLSNLPSA